MFCSCPIIKEFLHDGSDLSMQPPSQSRLAIPSPPDISYQVKDTAKSHIIFSKKLSSVTPLMYDTLLFLVSVHEASNDVQSLHTPREAEMHTENVARGGGGGGGGANAPSPPLNAAMVMYTYSHRPRSALPACSPDEAMEKLTAQYNPQ